LIFGRDDRGFDFCLARVVEPHIEAIFGFNCAGIRGRAPQNLRDPAYLSFESCAHGFTDDGMICEHWGLIDIAAIMRQLGAEG